jgi:L,D-transpeptidase ErfK/SrfK
MRRSIHGPLAAAAAVFLAGCSLLSHPWTKAPPPPPVAVEAPPPEPPPLPAPVDTHKFTLADPDDDVVGTVQITTTSKEDTLPDIARRFNVGYEEIVRANPGVDPWIPGAGRHVVVPTRFVLPNAPRDGIVIDVAAMRLYYFPPHKKGEPVVVYTHPIGVGQMGWSTPEGTTHITGRQKDPKWIPGPGVRKEHHDQGDDLPAVVPAGPDNPLGKYKFTLGWPEYLIHGTNKPYGVGLRSSHGCVRLYPEDIEKLFEMVPNGTPVHVVNQPFLFGWHDGQLYLQAYTVLEDDRRNWSGAQKKLLSKLLSPRLQKQLKDHGQSIDWDAVAALIKQPRGIPVSIPSEGGLDAVLAAAPLVQNRVPDGANWNGIDETGESGVSAQPLLSEREPAAAQAAAPAKPRG